MMKQIVYLYCDDENNKMDIQDVIKFISKVYTKYVMFQPPSTDTVPELSSPPVLTGAGGVVQMLGEVPHPPPGLPMPQYNMGDYIGHNAWPANIIVPINQPLEVRKHYFFKKKVLFFIILTTWPLLTKHTHF